VDFGVALVAQGNHILGSIVPAVLQLNNMVAALGLTLTHEAPVKPFPWMQFAFS